MTDRIEFYGDGHGSLGAVESSMVPLVGSKISIRGRTWTVRRVTYCLDYADNPRLTQMRANVDVTPE